MRDWPNLIAWCEAHDFKWAIVGEKFYWQTNYQTAECNSNGHIARWHTQEYFNEIVKESAQHEKAEN